MLSAVSIGAGFRRLLHLVIVTSAALVVAAPLLLGPALGAALHALGAEGTHHCACGMQRGRCGCPECEELEAQRLREDVEAPVARVRPSCDDGAYLPGVAVLPPSVVPSSTTLPAVPDERLVLDRRLLPRPEALPIRPPTPPPRARAA